MVSSCQLFLDASSHLYKSLSVRRSIRRFVRQSVGLSIHPSVCPSIRPSVRPSSINLPQPHPSYQFLISNTNTNQQPTETGWTCQLTHINHHLILFWTPVIITGYTTSRPFDGETTYIHDYVWFDEYGNPHPYPCPDPRLTVASVPKPFLPWQPISKTDYPHWKGVVPPESWKPDLPYRRV